VRKEYEFLVIGSGVAGLTYALKVAEHGKVAVVTKSHLDHSSTALAQGGIAAVTYAPDTFEQHIDDTMIAGSHISNREVVEMFVHEAPERIAELIEWGTNFDKNEDGTYELAREGGHSQYRILHHKDQSGFEIERALIEKVKSHPNIDIYENHFAIEVITQHHLGFDVHRSNKNIECFGSYVLDLNSNEVITFLAKTTMIATGSSGNVYANTTCPTVATGDGIAMVYRAKGTIEGMEFFQFHPTGLYNPTEKPCFLISEAVRGYGGILRTQDGKEFMQKYDERGCLAPRDIVARAIDNEMKTRGENFVYLDCRHLEEKALKAHFPKITEKCASIGIDIAKDMIPVVPVAHYQCGGIKVDMNGESHIHHLYAAGECSSTGLHGGNRLASNSLSEALVYAHRAAMHAIDVVDKLSYKLTVPDWDFEGTSLNEEMVLITQSYHEMQSIMSNYVGIVRSDLRLDRALIRLNVLYKETEELFKRSTLSRQLCELRNMINVGYLIIKQAKARKESVGLHYTVDYPPVKK